MFVRTELDASTPLNDWQWLAPSRQPWEGGLWESDGGGRSMPSEPGEVGVSQVLREQIDRVVQASHRSVRLVFGLRTHSRMQLGVCNPTLLADMEGHRSALRMNAISPNH